MTDDGNRNDSIAAEAADVSRLCEELLSHSQSVIVRRGVLKALRQCCAALNGSVMAAQNSRGDADDGVFFSARHAADAIRMNFAVWFTSVYFVGDGSVVDDDDEAPLPLFDTLLSLERNRSRLEAFEADLFSVLSFVLPFSHNDQKQQQQQFCKNDALLAWLLSFFTRTSDDSDAIPPSLEHVAFLLSVVLGCDRVLKDRRLESFVSVTLAMLNSSVTSLESLTIVLQPILCGTLHAADLYSTDLVVLLEILRRHVSQLETQIRVVDETDGARRKQLLDAVAAVKRAEACLLADMRPSSESSVDDVCNWFAKLNLSRDYSATLRFEGVDGDVLCSDLSHEDLSEMGITEASDVGRVFQLLRFKKPC